MDKGEIKELEKAIAQITQKAREFGLDFFEMRYEICPADVIYTFGAYGMPSRFSHWSFGKAYHRLKTQYDYNLSRIYELVINSDPCYAFLLDGNTLLQNKVIAAHVLAHSDFFKNNYRFARTNRNMVETMAANAERIREHEFRHGREAVEAVLDAALALQDQVDPFPRPRLRDEEEPPPAPPEDEYEDLWQLDRYLPENRAAHQVGRGAGRPGAPSPASLSAPRGGPAAERLGDPRQAHPQPGPAVRLPRRRRHLPERDLLFFLMEHAPYLEDWEREILAIVREESLYFRPQLETKIMNEGWASLWHARIMRELDLTEEESVEFAKMHAAVLAPSRMHLNPYYVGMKIFEDIERRWDHPSEEGRRRFGLPGGQGREKIFEVRQVETDVSFIRNYLTKELVEELDLYLYRKVGDQWQIVTTDWEEVRDGLVRSLTNCGIPTILVADDDYRGAGELLLHHSYDGQELDVPYLEKTLPYVHRLWGRPVHLETVLDGRAVRFTYDGRTVTRT